MYTTDHNFPVPPIKDFINEYSDMTMQFKLATCMKSSVSNLHVLFSACVVRKATAYVETMCHQL